MKEEEEDRALLSSLGVTSANPDEIEHDILEQVFDFDCFVRVSFLYF